jgi:outer membrane protein assembly factor BamB
LVKPGRLPFADYFANLVVSACGLAGNKEPRWPEGELWRVLRPNGGIAWLDGKQLPSRRDELAGAGRWEHQYGNTKNTAASEDRLIHPNLRLQWFGGPGPARMVDRHLRAPAPLVAGGCMFVAGENSLVCVDSYHGTEYWQLDIPNSQRYSMPYDCGYASIDGDRLAMAVQNSAWLIDVRTGQVTEKIPVPLVEKDREPHWGYLALSGDRLYGSTQKPTASRTLPSRDQIDRDYNNDRPVVTGTGLFLMDLPSKKIRWHHEAIILNPTITLSEDRVFFVASTDNALQDHNNGRILLPDLLVGGADIVALDSLSGQVVWRKPLDRHMATCRNILYLQASGDRLILSGSYHRDNDSWYRVAVLDASSGDTIWVAEHEKGKPEAFTHGEQVHHPVILGSRLICEPAIYELESGRRIAPGGQSEAWTLTRPEHSCGTMSGAGDCLFFRSGNPTVMDLRPGSDGRERFRKISPSRPGCWINIIPADGLVLIPEASASCVCHYSLQTSMAFQPVPAAEE